MPKDPEPLYQLGMTYLSGGSATLALQAFQNAVSLNPAHQGAQYQVALFEVGSKKPEDVIAAKEVLEKYSADHPNSAESLGALALADAKLGNKAEALKRLNAAVAKDPSQLRPVSVVIAFYAAQGDVATAKEIVRNLGEQLPNSPEAATMRAQVSLATGDAADADAQISRALALKPDYAPALALRLRRDLMVGDQAGAENASRDLAKLPLSRTWSAYARTLFAERKFDEGSAEFERVIKEHGDPVEVRDEYTDMLIAAGRRKQAEAIVGGTLAKSPKDKTALLQRATLELDAGNTDGASKDITALLGMKAFSGMLSYQQSRLAAARGDTVKEGELLTDALRFSPGLFSARVDLVRLLCGAGKGQNALEILDQARPAQKTTTEYIFYRNMALMAAGEWDQARKGVDAGLARVHAPTFLTQDAVLRVRQHDLPGARKSLEESFRMVPSDSLTLNLLAEVMREQGQTQQYLGMLRDAVAKDPKSAGLQNALGAQLATLGDLKGARVAYTAARDDGDVMGADVAIAAVDVQSGALDAAKQRMTELIKSHDSARAWMLLAEIDTRKGLPGNAIQDYLRAIDLQPSNVDAMNNLADLIADNPNTSQDALFWANKALALAPGSPIVEDTIGWVYYRQGKYADAVSYLDKSLKTMDRPVVHYHLAAALLKSGDATRGRTEYELAVKRDPKSSLRPKVGPLFGEK